jgi:hypothetical protein
MAKEPTKPAPEAPAASEPAPAPEPFSHPGKRVFILVPQDSKERDIVLKFLEDTLFPLCETLPVVTSELKLERFRGEEIVYVAHPIDGVRQKGQDGRFRSVVTVHVSAPADLSAFVSQDAEGFASLSPLACEVAIAPLCKPTREGRCYQLRMSQDNICKLFNQ